MVRLNTTLDTSKIQHVLPKIKNYSLSIKIGLPRKKTFKLYFCVPDITVSLPNFICSEPFYTENEVINLLDHNDIHLDHKYV